MAAARTMGSSKVPTSPRVGSTPFSGRARWCEERTGLTGALARPGAASMGTGPMKQAARNSARVVFPSRVIGDIRRVPQNLKILRENRALYKKLIGKSTKNCDSQNETAKRRSTVTAPHRPKEADRKQGT